MTDLDAEWELFQNQLINNNQSKYVTHTIKKEIQTDMNYQNQFLIEEDVIYLLLA